MAADTPAFDAHGADAHSFDARADLYGLGRLRDRIEAAVREVERLRAENAALAERLAALQQEAGAAPAGPADPALRALTAGQDPEALCARLRGFIAAIDEALRTTASATSGSADPDPGSSAD